MKNLKNIIKLLIIIVLIIIAFVIGFLLFNINSDKNKIDTGYKIFGNNYCTGHRYDGLAGQAFTTWICEICGYKATYSNTNVPIICSKCARITSRCKKCGKLTVPYNVICKENINFDSKIISNYQDYIKFVQYIDSTNKNDKKVFDFDSSKYTKKYFDTKSLVILNIEGISKIDGIDLYIDDNTLISNITRNYYYSKTERNNSKVILAEIDKSITNFKIKVN